MSMPRVLSFKMILSHVHRFIFLKTRKTAGTSIELALSALCGPGDIVTPVTPQDELARQGRGPQNWNVRGDWLTELQRNFRTLTGRRTRPTFYNHMPAQKIRRVIGRSMWDSYFKFTIERNPWDRQVSQYFWDFQDPTTRPPFDNYIDSLRQRKPASNFSIYAINGRVAVDYVCQYDRLESELSTVMDRIGISEPLSIPRAKSNFRTTDRHWREFYTPRTRDIVADLHSREISAFGYTFS
jgi:hypothetical protein